MLMDQAQVRCEANEHRYISKKEVALRLNRTPRTVEHWMRRGYLPYKKVGRSVLFDWGEIERHFNERFTVSPTVERLPLGLGRQRPNGPTGKRSA